MIVDVPGLPVRRRGGKIIGYAIVDADLFVRLNDFQWHRNNNYVARTGLGGRQIYLHREVLQVPWDVAIGVDHINGNKFDNRRANLRLSTHAQNGQNLAPWRPRFGYRGVQFDARRGHWIAQCMLNGRYHHLGRFGTEEAAAQAAADFRALHMPFSMEARS